MNETLNFMATSFKCGSRGDHEVLLDKYFVKLHDSFGVMKSINYSTFNFYEAYELTKIENPDLLSKLSGGAMIFGPKEGDFAAVFCLYWISRYIDENPKEPGAWERLGIFMSNTLYSSSRSWLNADRSTGDNFPVGRAVSNFAFFPKGVEAKIFAKVFACSGYLNYEAQIYSSDNNSFLYMLRELSDLNYTSLEDWISVYNSICKYSFLVQSNGFSDIDLIKRPLQSMFLSECNDAQLTTKINNTVYSFLGQFMDIEREYESDDLCTGFFTSVIGKAEPELKELFENKLNPALYTIPSTDIALRFMLLSKKRSDCFGERENSGSYGASPLHIWGRPDYDYKDAMLGEMLDLLTPLFQEGLQKVFKENNLQKLV